MAASSAASPLEPLTGLPEWRALQAHYQEIKSVHLRDLFLRESTRGERLVAEGAGVGLETGGVVPWLHADSRSASRAIINNLRLSNPGVLRTSSAP